VGFRPGRCGLHALCNLAQACDSQPAACEWPTSSVACMVHHSGAVYPSIGSSASLRFASLRCAALRCAAHGLPFRRGALLTVTLAIPCSCCLDVTGGWAGPSFSTTSVDVRSWQKGINANWPRTRRFEPPKKDYTPGPGTPT
jgi:hypothetical protein